MLPAVVVGGGGHGGGRFQALVSAAMLAQNLAAAPSAEILTAADDLRPDNVSDEQVLQQVVVIPRLCVSLKGNYLVS